jgi:UDP-N-acetylglucosamine:LPS N-acetylglucosamine transferase
VRGLVAAPDRLARMGERARTLARPEAAGDLAGLLFEIEREAA